MLSILKKLFGSTNIDFKELVDKGAIIIDVRSANEFKAGHIPNAKNYPVDTIQSKAAELKKINKPIITVCRSGARSSMAKGILTTAGLEVYNGGPWTSLMNKL